VRLAPEIPFAERMLSAEQRLALSLARKGVSFFFTGPGGTGKSYLLRILVQELRKTHGREAVHVTASTGV
jgi:ATP-dependent DNA helicase PIF1